MRKPSAAWLLEKQQRFAQFEELEGGSEKNLCEVEDPMLLGGGGACREGPSAAIERRRSLEVDLIGPGAGGGVTRLPTPQGAVPALLRWPQTTQL